jgi:hypothetical protein
MDAGGNANQEVVTKTTTEEEDTANENVVTSSSNVTSNHPHLSTSLNLTVPVRYLYHEQAKSIIAIQVGILNQILYAA